MARVVLELADDQLDFAAGGVFVPDCAPKLLEDCELVIVAKGTEIVVAARAVFVNANGAGFELSCTAEQKQQLAALASPPDEAETKKVARNVHERLRGLTLVQQIKIASTGETSERIILERMYGKTVWDPLLRNPRITSPEVARIARMGGLPKPMIELICSNGAWIQIPEVRRALLSNPRLAPEQAIRLVRLLPKHELKLACAQVSYPHAVREAAKRVLREISQ
jgi:hypothetical protein